MHCLLNTLNPIISGKCKRPIQSLASEDMIFKNEFVNDCIQRHENWALHKHELKLERLRMCKKQWPRSKTVFN
ncbi:hypothetical protein GJ496_008277 [Pomphorhynchus laevis]|nr:hypothetical protein GJ496_008277 [Pomphorhynchus laevis]